MSTWKSPDQYFGRITFNNATREAIAIKCIFNNNFVGSTNGGLLYADNPNLKISFDSCEFIGCQTQHTNGGVMYINSADSVVMKSCCVIQARAKTSQFAAVHSNTCNITNTIISRCGNISNNFEVMTILSNVNISVINHSSNAVTEISFASIYKSNSCIIKNLVSINNSVESNPQFLIRSSTNVLLDRIIFINCRSTYKDPGVAWFIYSEITIYNSKFGRNFANSVKLTNSTCSLIKCQFDEQISESFSISDSNFNTRVEISISETDLTCKLIFPVHKINWEKPQSIDLSKYTRIEISNSIFANIHSKTHGGAVCVDNVYSNMLITRSIFKNINCETNAGAIFNIAKYGNSSIYTSCFNNVSAFKYGTMFVSLSNFFKIQDAAFVENTAYKYCVGVVASSLIYQANFTKNSATDSPGVNSYNYLSLTFVYWSNSTGSGDINFLSGDENNIMISRSFYINSASTDNCSLFSANKKTIVVISSTFFNLINLTLFSGNSMVSFNNCTFDVFDCQASYKATLLTITEFPIISYDSKDYCIPPKRLGPLGISLIVISVVIVIVGIVIAILFGKKKKKRNKFVFQYADSEVSIISESNADALLPLYQN
ncbi:hypothetical protein TVAG_271950 [Trichomonas vaginalis G3]|uniref:Uncharacterized protein n=1 Tax=Trichomonas vaginalis (strain ATCC PRA-98 / G3) TaxID=412133 RepID=A2E5U2_TRIV3|nr:hypothetical protein TVAGG3_0256860 [Trichomonas vaginalis G3]EAY12012.1 hypothetical protein TVAG_271950 [Trichomonas vaginalis G3]KAI5524814.1 hypothetical protein TVAGG3_0256860 [Trichomonas vaginalis G3]|eukprot:XP_001324235.1 hypothetical protein [Trichomonas vaginalis G3]